MPVILLVAAWLQAQTQNYSFKQRYVFREGSDFASVKTKVCR